MHTWTIKGNLISFDGDPHPVAHTRLQQLETKIRIGDTHSVVWTNEKNLQTVLTVTSIMIYECCTLQWGRRSLLERSNGVGGG